MPRINFKALVEYSVVEIGAFQGVLHDRERREWFQKIVDLWSYASHGAQCGVTTSHSTCCSCCVCDYHICFRLFAFVKSFRAHVVFERSTKGG